MRIIVLLFTIFISCFSTFAQVTIDRSTNKISNYHEQLDFNSLGYNDYDLGTQSYLQFSKSIIKIDIDDSGKGTLIAYLLGQKTFYYINKCILEQKTGSYEFQLFDKDDLIGDKKNIISVGATLVIENNIIQAFQIYKKGMNEAYVLINR